MALANGISLVGLSVRQGDTGDGVDKLKVQFYYIAVLEDVVSLCHCAIVLP